MHVADVVSNGGGVAGLEKVEDVPMLIVGLEQQLGGHLSVNSAVVALDEAALELRHEVHGFRISGHSCNGIRAAGRRI